MPELRENPFRDRGGWYWRNAEQRVNGPYNTQQEALLSLMRSLDTRSKWRKFTDLMREFIQS